MAEPIFIGVDPGASGGLACLRDGKVFSLESMPETEADVFDWFRSQNDSQPDAFAVIERVGGFVKGNPAPGSAMFNFGRSYGGLRMALVARGIPFEDYTPQMWQKAMGITPRGKDESHGAFKNRLKARAQQLFPGVKITLATCDALLLADFCRRMRTSLPARGTLFT